MSVFQYDADGAYIDKDPRARLDYTINWTDWLKSGESIASSVWSAATGVTIASTLVSGSKSTVWVSGGDAGSSYTIRNFIITSTNNEEARSFRLKVDDK